jgi:hypothetical protein
MGLLVTVIDPLGVGRRAVGAAGRAGTAVVENATARIVNELLADGVVEQIADRVLSGPELERIVDSEAMERFAARVLDGPGADRLVEQLLNSKLLDAAVTRVLASAQLWHVVEEVAASPAVTDAISRQGFGFADQVVEEVGARSRRADALLERAAQRILRRPAGGVGTGPVGPAPAMP